VKLRKGLVADMQSGWANDGIQPDPADNTCRRRGYCEGLTPPLADAASAE
jgi:hypothetical protein